MSLNYLQPNGKRCPIMRSGEKIGYVSFFIVNETNEAEYLGRNLYLSRFIEGLPPSFGVLEEIYLEEPYRNKGNGTNIMRDILHYLKKRVPMVYLVPHPLSKTKQELDGDLFHQLRMGLIEFYERLGFIENDPRYVDAKNLSVSHRRPMFLTFADTDKKT